MGTYTSSKVCTKCLKEKPQEEFRTRGEGKSHGVHRYQHCKQCEKEIATVTREAKRKCDVTKSTCCDICGRVENVEKYKNSKIVFDHDHTTGKFRGWICDSCNRGLSNLGDNIDGVVKALNYLIERR
jgi:hypothetical protein